MPTTILVADDSKTVRRAMQLALAKQPDFELVFATNTEELLTKIKTKNPQLVLLDDGLSQNALEQAKTLKTQLGDKSTVALMGHRYEAEFKPYLKKPFDAAALLSVIQPKSEKPSPHLVGRGQGEGQISTAAIESLARQKIEEVVWEVVPELAEKLIKQELQKLMAEK